MKQFQTRYFAVLFLLALIFLPGTAAAKDEWMQVRSKNFNLIGDAGEKDIRKVATKLEQFRETFRLLFTKTNLNAAIPTNVVVFRSAGSYKPFKPKRADGKTDNFVAGYFQPGEDVNYITLAADGNPADVYGTIFHEYVHFILDTNFGKSDIPPWFNEGLAEYYQTFEIENDQKVKLGLPQGEHLNRLQQNKMIPLETFFGISNYALHQNSNHSRSIFYSQSWALIHYLIQSGKTDGLGKFLELSVKSAPSEKIFQDAFQMNYQQMEKELKKYVAKSTYQYSGFDFKEKLVFDADMQVSPLSEAATNAYLGDLLYHTNRADDAEAYLRQALAADPKSSMANTTYGMVKIRQRKFDEAKTYLDRAISEDQRNHLAFYQYAYLLSREGRDEFGYVSTFPPEKSEKMRELLKKAIAINPAYTESYELIAFVNLVNNEQLDEAVKYLLKALQYQPGNQKYTIRIAEIYLRQENFKEAAALAQKLAATSDDAQIKSRAENLAAEIGKMQDFSARQEQARKSFEDSIANAEKNGGVPVFVRRSSEEELSPEELAKVRENEELISLNYSLTKPAEGEKQVFGRIQKIECKAGAITYPVKTETGTLVLSSKDFTNLNLMAFTKDSEQAQVGCGENLALYAAVLTYKPLEPGKTQVQGELKSIEFVPENFRFVDLEAEKKRTAQIIEETRNSSMPPPPGAEEDSGDSEKERRNMMLESMKNAMRPVQAGEKREIGLLDRIECTNKGTFFHFSTAAAQYKLKAASPDSVQIMGFTPEIEQVQFGCNLKKLDIKVVFTFKEAPKAGKDKAVGEIIALEFVPKSFEL